VVKRAIFFFQARAGLHSHHLKITKFKTMRGTFDEEGNPLQMRIV
jgi:lipopolysaccharide/colanic/teichoic acid biosynthesis glycosyltransferase